jgi:hypothetical protein
MTQSPFTNSLARRAHGMATLVEMAELFGMGKRKAERCLDAGLLPPPDMQTPSGKYKLWKLSSLEGLVIETQDKRLGSFSGVDYAYTGQVYDIAAARRFLALQLPKKLPSTIGDLATKYAAKKKMPKHWLIRTRIISDAYSKGTK